MPRKSRGIKKTDRDKPWSRKKIRRNPYKLEFRSKAKSFLIICEGENTEPEYFKSFPVGNAEVESYGLGQSKTALVEYVIEIVENAQSVDREVWVVFDMDVQRDQQQSQKQDFDYAIELAQQKGFKVAYSNDAFELWFLLHYQYLEAQWSRNQYYDRLSELWNCSYAKEGKKRSFCRKIYQRLLDDQRSEQAEAIQRGQKLFEEHIDLPYSSRNPCTTVFQLVEELNGYL